MLISRFRLLLKEIIWVKICYLSVLEMVTRRLLDGSWVQMISSKLVVCRISKAELSNTWCAYTSSTVLWMKSIQGLIHLITMEICHCIIAFNMMISLWLGSNLMVTLSIFCSETTDTKLFSMLPPAITRLNL